MLTHKAHSIPWKCFKALKGAFSWWIIGVRCCTEKKLAGTFLRRAPSVSYRAYFCRWRLELTISGGIQSWGKKGSWKDPCTPVQGTSKALHCPSHLIFPSLVLGPLCFVVFFQGHEKEVALPTYFLDIGSQEDKSVSPCSMYESRWLLRVLFWPIYFDYMDILYSLFTGFIFADSVLVFCVYWFCFVGGGGLFVFSPVCLFKSASAKATTADVFATAALP